LQKFDEATRERPWGTADALMSAAAILDCPFIICNGDDIYGESTFKTLADHLIKMYESRGYRFIEYHQWGITNYRSVVMSKKL